MTAAAQVVEDAAAAAVVLRRGGIVAIPTETVYGLAALVRDRRAVQRVFEVKGRPLNHPLIVHVASVEEARRWGRLDDRATTLAEAYWPGPLTMVVPRTDDTPDWVTGGRDTVALRIPDHPLTLSLLEILDDALVAPSANRFGKVSPTTADHVVADLGDDVELVLDGGRCRIGVESTIVEILDELQILRPGAVSGRQIGQTLEVAVSETSGSSRAPGMLKSHYAPAAQVIVCDSASDADDMIARERDAGRRTALLHYPDVDEYARQMYGFLRDADADGIQVVVAVKAPDDGLGAAINDRLHKAAASPEDI